MKNDLLKREIIEIQPVSVCKNVKIRVAGYARVSSNSDDQLNSFASQVSHYTVLIEENPRWELVDIYADESLSGTTTSKRSEFLRLIADCKQGKIDKIITKYISRFARNTIDTISSIRELKSMGIGIYFEKEEIDTTDLTSENLVTLYATFAQEESLMISQNCKKGVRMRMERGNFVQSKAPFGYRLVNGELEVQEEESKIIQRIFGEYLCGNGVATIAKSLTNEGIPHRNGRTSWRNQYISEIIRNERYIGDTLLQKRYSEDVLPYTKKRNQGDLPQYYIENTHKAIVSREDFAIANELLAKKGQKVKTNSQTFPLSRKIICSNCGSTFTRKVTRGKPYWVCRKHDQNAEDCSSERIPETAIYEAFLRLVHKLKANYQWILEPLAESLREIRQIEELESMELRQVNKDLADIAEQNHAMTGLVATGLLDSSLFLEQTNELKQKMNKLKVEKGRLLEVLKKDRSLEQTEEIILALEEAPSNLEEFSIEMFEELVSSLKCTTKDEVTFVLINGLELPERL